MKIYVLRHEERGLNPLPLSSLTQQGFINSLGLIKKIGEINPDIIYCSPFLRTIETIYPYCKFNNKKINIENSLYEYVHAPQFKYYNYIHRPIDLNKNVYQKLMTTCIDTTYESFMDVYNINFPEIEGKLLHRVHKFIYKITHDKKLDNKTILLVTHMSVVNAVKSYVKPTNLEAQFEMGQIEQII